MLVLYWILAYIVVVRAERIIKKVPFIEDMVAPLLRLIVEVKNPTFLESHSLG